VHKFSGTTILHHRSKVVASMINVKEYCDQSISMKFGFIWGQTGEHTNIGGRNTRSKVPWRWCENT